MSGGVPYPDRPAGGWNADGGRARLACEGTRARTGRGRTGPALGSIIERETNMKNGVRMLWKSAVLAVSAAAVGGAAQAEEIKLRWGHYLPNSGFVQVEKNFAQKIEERTNGRVKIEITFAGGRQNTS